MPGTGRLCPICDSQIDRGATKCSFCGTDLTIFGSESEGAEQEEERVVQQSQLAAEAKPAVPAAPKAEPAKAAPAAEEALFQCPNCNGAVKESDNVCPHCGAMFVEEEVSQFECPACGTLVNADATTCPGCGAIFVEEGEGAEEAAPAEEPKAAQAAAPTPAPAQTPAPAPAAAPATTQEAQAEGEDMIIVTEGSSEATAQDEEIRRKVLEIKEGRGAEAEGVKKVRKPGLGGLFKGAKKEEGAAVPQKAIAAPKPAAETAAPTMTLAPPPTTKRQLPTDPKAQGVELAKMVNDVRSLLNIATERRLVIDESKDMLDRAIAAGRERQLQNALTLLSTAEDRLNVRLREYAVATFSSLQDEIAVAKKLGGNTAKSEVLAKEAKRAAETPDYQATFVFIDKAKAELSPITGKYNSVRDILRKYERLVKDSRAVGIDNEPLKETLEEAKAAFEVLDFEKAESIAHGSTEEIMGQVKTRIGPEIDKAKSMLVEVKMKAEAGGVGPQITILKSAIKAYKEENYLEALAEIKRFKKEMKKLITPA